jgi:hypothetical protein
MFRRHDRHAWNGRAPRTRGRAGGAGAAAGRWERCGTGCATGGVAAQLVVPPVRASTSPTRWEYHCAGAKTSDDGGVTSTLNKLGAEGWELAG